MVGKGLEARITEFYAFLKIPEKNLHWFLLKTTRPASFSFGYGQYVILEEDGSPFRKKTLALASSPHEGSFLSFVVAEKEGFRLNHGLKLSVPQGGFPALDAKKIFIVTHGVGITAVTGILHDIAKGRLKIDCQCLWGIRRHSELSLLEKLGIPSSMVEPVFSQEKGLRQGYVQDHLWEFFSKDYLYLLSGSAPMLQAVKDKLLGLGAHESQIYLNF
ncbi:MAG: hypothetical protein RML34_04715 [Leptospiraceae bacterium]|nr:hypothetical protein [Leptospiraceae bacterium]